MLAVEILDALISRGPFRMDVWGQARWCDLSTTGATWVLETNLAEPLYGSHRVALANYDTTEARAALRAWAQWHANASPNGVINQKSLIFTIHPSKAVVLPDAWLRWLRVEYPDCTWDTWQQLMGIAIRSYPIIDRKVHGIRAVARMILRNPQHAPLAPVYPPLPPEWQEVADRAFWSLSPSSRSTYTSRLRALLAQAHAVGVPPTTPAVEEWVKANRCALDANQLAAWRRVAAVMGLDPAAIRGTASATGLGEAEDGEDAAPDPRALSGAWVSLLEGAFEGLTIASVGVYRSNLRRLVTRAAEGGADPTDPQSVAAYLATGAYIPSTAERSAWNRVVPHLQDSSALPR